MDKDHDRKRRNRDDSGASGRKIHKETKSSGSMHPSRSSDSDEGGLPLKVSSAEERRHDGDRRLGIASNKESMAGPSNVQQNINQKKIFPQKLFRQNLFPHQNLLSAQASRGLGPEYCGTSTEDRIPGASHLQKSSIQNPGRSYHLLQKAAGEEVVGPSNSLQGWQQQQSASSRISPVKSPHPFPGYFDEYADGDKFLNLSYEELIKRIAKDELLVSTESVVFEAVLRWIGHDRERRKVFARNLMENVRFRFTSLDYLFEGVLKHPFMISAQFGYMVEDPITYKKREASKRDKGYFARKSHDPHVLYVFAAGNIDQEDKSVLEPCIQRYDFASDVWSDIKGNVPSSRSGVLSYKGRIWFIGGIKGQTQEKMEAHRKVFSCVPSEHGITWEEEKDLRGIRCDHGVAVYQGEIYVVGGRNGTNRHCVPLDTVEVYRKGPYGWDWTTIKPMNAARWNHGVVATELKLFAYGGGKDFGDANTTAEYYTKLRDQWTYARAIPHKHCPFYVTAIDGWLYVVGGDRNARIKEIRPHENTWRTITFLHEDARGDGRVVAVHNSKLYVLSVHLLRSIGEPRLFRYDPVEVEWSEMKKPDIMGYGVRGVIYYSPPGFSSTALQVISGVQKHTVAEGRISNFGQSSHHLGGDIQGAWINKPSFQSISTPSGQAMVDPCASQATSFENLPCQNAVFAQVIQPPFPRHQPPQTWRLHAVMQDCVPSTRFRTRAPSSYGYQESIRGYSARTTLSPGKPAAFRQQTTAYPRVPYPANRSLVMEADTRQQICLPSCSFQQSPVPHQANQPAVIVSETYRPLYNQNPAVQQSALSNPMETRVVESPRQTVSRGSLAMNLEGISGPVAHLQEDSSQSSESSFSSGSATSNSLADGDPVLNEYIDDLTGSSDGGAN